MSDARSGLEARFQALEEGIRGLLTLLDEGGAPVERIDAAREGCHATLTGLLAELAASELGDPERDQAARRLRGLLALSAVARERVEAECSDLAELQGRVRGERERLRGMDHRPETPGGSCDLSA